MTLHWDCKRGPIIFGHIEEFLWIGNGRMHRLENRLPRPRRDPVPIQWPDHARPIYPVEIANLAAPSTRNGILIVGPIGNNVGGSDKANQIIFRVALKAM